MNKRNESSAAKNTSDRAYLSTVIETVLDGLYFLAPMKTAKTIRKYGFYAPRYKIGEKNKLLLQSAQLHRVQMGTENLQVFVWQNAESKFIKTALLVHGWGTSGLQLSSFVEPLLLAGYRVVTFDHKGHGQSTSSYSSYLEFIRGAEKVIEFLKNEVDVVIGHSMGASVALKVSEKIVKNMKIVAIAPMIEVHDLLATLGSRVGISSKVMRAIVKDIEKDGDLLLSQAADFDFVSISRHQVTFVHDRNDYVNPFSRSEQLRDQIFKAKIEETANLGHNRILRNKDVISKIVSFLK
ncbi:MAG: alpha/beta fold hydrolase [Pseudobdellovibrio sp.]